MSKILKNCKKKKKKKKVWELNQFCLRFGPGINIYLPILTQIQVGHLVRTESGPRYRVGHLVRTESGSWPSFICPNSECHHMPGAVWHTEQGISPALEVLLAPREQGLKHV
jgi:hypothetical protein